MMELALVLLLSQDKTVEVAVDDRMLLVTTAIWFATDGSFYGKPVDAAYVDAVRKHFAEQREHPAIRMAKDLTRTGFSYDAPISWILHYGDLPGLKEKVPPTEEQIRRTGSREKLNEFAQVLRDFAKDADFASFVRSQKEAHAAFVARVLKVLDAKGAVGRLESYFGETRDRYTLLIAPLIGSWNFGPSVNRDVFQVFNPAGYPDEASLRTGVSDMVYHEFGHSFVNPIVDAMKDRVDATAELFEPIRDQMRRQAYDNWLTVVREHFVRAAAARLVFLERDERAGGRQVADDLSRGFRYLVPLWKALDAFEKDRKRFPKFADFAPRMMEELEKITKEGSEAYWARQPFAGPINAVWANHKDKLVFVAPPEDARGIARKFEARIVTAEEALTMKLGEHVFIVYGTFTENAFLAKLAGCLPFKVEADAIAVDGERITGKGLRLIAAAPNPERPQLPIVIYTATKAELVSGINSVFHGPTAWIVADEQRKAVAKGHFRPK